jgi:riboflavin kinase/FMN adenylyltransferase
VRLLKVFNTLEEAKNIPRCAIALGNFDGVHKGHQELISKTVETAKKHGIKSAVFTFSNHPKNLIPGQKEVKNIIYQDEKEALIENLGVDYLYNIQFTEEILNTEPEDFVKKILVDKCNIAEAFCGFNYRFGYNAHGDVKTLKKCGKSFGFAVNTIPPVIIDGEVVSSTLIRSLIKSGEVDECYKYLGRYYDIGGEVVIGNRLGKSIGFPTSNICIDENMVTPPNGVYVTYCIYNKTVYPSVTNVGVKPTIGYYKKNVETHIFNFDKELYGKYIKVEFLKMMRDEVKFNSIEELVAQITRDCESAKDFHMNFTREC